MKISDYVVGVVTSAYSEAQLSVLGDVRTPDFASIVATEEQVYVSAGWGLRSGAIRKPLRRSGSVGANVVFADGAGSG